MAFYKLDDKEKKSGFYRVGESKITPDMVTLPYETRTTSLISQSSKEETKKPQSTLLGQATGVKTSVDRRESAAKMISGWDDKKKREYGVIQPAKTEKKNFPSIADQQEEAKLNMEIAQNNLLAGIDVEKSAADYDKWQSEYNRLLKEANPDAEKDGNIIQKGLRLAGTSALKGMAGFNTAIAQTLNLIPQAVSDIIGVENKSPTAALVESRKKAEESISAEAAEAAEKLGYGGEVASNLLSTTVQALPNAVLALASGGSSAVSQLAPKAAGISGAISSGLRSVLSNPMTKTSFLQTVGSEYESAKESGATAGEALVAAVGSSLAMSGVEALGGVETLPQSLRTGGAKAWVNLLKSAGEEAIEEPVQNVLSSAIHAGVYDRDRPIFSTTDESAVFNPAREAESAAYAFGSGLLLGGGQALTQRALSGWRGGQSSADATITPDDILTISEQKTPAEKSVQPSEQAQTIQEVQPSLIERAVSEFNERGSVTNSTATAILNDPESVSELEKSGLSISSSMSNSQRRAAVKSAVAKMQKPDVSPADSAIQDVLDILEPAQQTEPAQIPDSIAQPERQPVSEYERWGLDSSKIESAKKRILESGMSGNDQSKYQPLIDEYGYDNLASALSELLQSDNVKLNAGGVYSPTAKNTHIDSRDPFNVASRKMNAFQYDNPEIQPYMTEAARMLIDDVQNTVRGERRPVDSSDFSLGWTGTKRNTTEEIASMKDKHGMTYDKIIKGAEDIIADKGAENNANAKRVEYYLDKMLTEGHTTPYGEEIPANQSYIAAKEKIPGAVQKQPEKRYSTFEEFLSSPLYEMMIEEGADPSEFLPAWEEYQQETRDMYGETQAPAISQPEQPAMQETESVGAAPAQFTGDTVSKYSKNLATDQARADEVREDVRLDPDKYNRLGNKTVTDAALKILDDNGFDGARSILERNLADARSGKKLPPAMVPLSKMVIDQLYRDGEYVAGRNLRSSVSAELTAAGQLANAAKLLRDATPQDRVDSVQKTVDILNDELKRRYGKNLQNLLGKEDIQLNPDEVQALMAVPDGDEQGFQEVYEKIAQRIGKEMPATAWQKFSEIRRIAMLLNPKTQIRNVVGNIPMAIERKAASALSGAIQGGLVKSGKLDASERTKVAVVSDDAKSIARQIWQEQGQEIMTGTDKWDMNAMIRKYRKYFGDTAAGKAADALREFTYSLLEKGDQPFFRNAFLDSLGSVIDARGIKSIDSVTPEMIEIATQDAATATFRDSSALSKALSQIKQKGGIWGGALDVILPFTTTPINIARQSVAYSPAGALNAVYQATRGETVAAVDALSKALVGSAGWGVAALLAKFGIITGAAEDDKDAMNFQLMIGNQPYSFFGKVTYDWAQPFGTQLAAGAAVYDALSGNDSAWEAFLDASISSGDVLLDMSVLSNVQDLFSGYASPSETIFDTIVSGLFSQATPSVLGSIARVIDPKVRTSVTGEGIVDDAIAGVISKTPFASATLPEVVDQWGRDNERPESFFVRLVDQLINPATANFGQPTEVDSALLDLAETLDEMKKTDDTVPSGATVFPTYAAYSIDGEKLSGEERAQYQRTMGQNSLDFVTNLMDSELYKEATPIEQAEQISEAYSLAGAIAKKELDPSYSSPGWEKAFSAMENGIDVSDWFAVDSALKFMGGSGQNQEDFTSALESVPGLTDEEKSEIWSMQNSSWSPEKNPYTGTLAQAGLSPDEILDIMAAKSKADDLDASSRDQAAEFSKALDGMGLTEEQHNAAMDVYGFGVYIPVEPTAYDYKTMSDAQKSVWDNWANGKYEMEEFLRLYKTMTEYGDDGKPKTKSEAISDLQKELGDRTKAEAFYTFSSKSYK